MEGGKKICEIQETSWSTSGHKKNKAIKIIIILFLLHVCHHALSYMRLWCEQLLTYL